MGVLSSETSSTAATNLPPWLEQQVRDNLGIANQYAAGQQPAGIGAYPMYTGTRVPGLAPGQQRGMNLLNQSVGQFLPAIMGAAQTATAAGGRFTSADAERGMNPYMDAVMGEIRRQGEIERNNIGSRAAAAKAFGGSRQAVLEGMQREGEARNIGLQRANAFESARNQFNQENARGLQVAQLVGQLAQSGQQNRFNDINALMQAGALERGVNQQNADFNYQQFTEARDWPMRMLQLRLGATQGQPMPLSQTKTESGSGSTLGSILGLASTVAGLGGKNGFGWWGGATPAG